MITLAPSFSAWHEHTDLGLASAIRSDPCVPRPKAGISGEMWRDALARRLGVEPGRVSVGREPSGAPTLRTDNGAFAVSFSATSGLRACALSPGPAVGIDIERRTEQPDATGMIRIACRTGEAEALAMVLRCDEPPTLLLYAWTAKEAALKAHGAGLRIEPRACTLAARRGPDGDVEGIATIGERVFDLRWRRHTDWVLAVARERE
jgi:phosphopantetheinyl transferase